MNIRYILTFLLIPFCYSMLSAQEPAKPIEPSYFKLTSSNGLIVGVYNAKENRIDDVYPHLFANYDSGHYVYPFVGNIKLNSTELPEKTSYLKNTHVITASYKDFTINYFASFTQGDIIFYVVIKGEKQTINNLSFVAETGKGKPVSGITLLENHLQDLPIHIAGNALTGNVLRKYDNDVYEKYFLF